MLRNCLVSWSRGSRGDEGCLEDVYPRQDIVYGVWIGWIDVGVCSEEMAKVGNRIEFVVFGGFDNVVDNGACSGLVCGVGEEPALVLPIRRM